MVQVNSLNVLELVKKLEKGKPFTFVRYGDGEWRCILGYGGKNCDGHQYMPELKLALEEAVCSDDGVIWGMQRKAVKDLNVALMDYLAVNKIDRAWYDSDCLHKANIKGRLWPFVKALKTKRVLVVGPMHLGTSSLEFEQLIDVPKVDCFKKVDGVFKRVLDACKWCEVILFSSSMMTNVLQHRLWPLIGDKITMIDCGSMWDGYAGFKSRGMFRDPNMDWDKLKLVNMFGEQG